MKKARFMLTAITVLGIVAGALAFKAKTFGTSYCTAASTATHCPNGVAGDIVTTTSVAVVKYVTTSDITKCASDNPACSLTARIQGE